MSEVVIRWCARCWAGLGLEILNLGRNNTLYTHLGCFGGEGKVGEGKWGGGRRASGNTSQMSGFPIRQAVPVGLWARFCSWACWVCVFMVNNVYYSRCNVFTCNLLFFKYLGRQKWVDGVGYVWMTLFWLGRCSQLGWFLLLGVLGSVFQVEKYVHY